MQQQKRTGRLGFRVKMKRSGLIGGGGGGRKTSAMVKKLLWSWRNEFWAGSPGRGFWTEPVCDAADWENKSKKRLQIGCFLRGSGNLRRTSFTNWRTWHRIMRTLDGGKVSLCCWRGLRLSHVITVTSVMAFAWSPYRAQSSYCSFNSAPIPFTGTNCQKKK